MFLLGVHSHCDGKDMMLTISKIGILIPNWGVYMASSFLRQKLSLPPHCEEGVSVNLCACMNFTACWISIFKFNFFRLNSFRISTNRPCPIVSLFVKNCSWAFAARGDNWREIFHMLSRAGWTYEKSYQTIHKIQGTCLRYEYNFINITNTKD